MSPGEVHRWRRRGHRPTYCPHGRITQWSGTSRAGDHLPEIEHCEDCNPGAEPLGVPA